MSPLNFLSHFGWMSCPNLRAGSGMLMHLLSWMHCNAIPCRFLCVLLILPQGRMEQRHIYADFLIKYIISCICCALHALVYYFHAEFCSDGLMSGYCCCSCCWLCTNIHFFISCSVVVFFSKVLPPFPFLLVVSLVNKWLLLLKYVLRKKVFLFFPIFLMLFSLHFICLTIIIIIIKSWKYAAVMYKSIKVILFIKCFS